MKVIILAAGRGTRLGPHTAERPKALLRVGASTILERQVESVSQFLSEPPIIVIGYRGEMIRRELHGRARFIENPLFESTNSFYSLWLARDHFREGFVLLNADVVFHPLILERLLCSSFRDGLAFERKSRFEGEEMKVKLDGQRVMAISKDLAVADGESLGILKFSAEGARLLRERLEELASRCAARCWAPYAVNAMCAVWLVGGVDVSGLPWVEVDFASDLAFARRQVVPRIEAARSPAPLPPLFPGWETMPLQEAPAFGGPRG